MTGDDATADGGTDTATESDDETVTLRDEDLHRPEELDGETIACTLTETEAEKRAAWIRSEMVPHLEAIERREGGASGDGDGTSSHDESDAEETSGGYTLVFAEEALEAVMRFARHEHWCCSFAHFEVHVTPGEQPNELSVYGPEGTEEMFGEEFVSVMAGEAGVSVSG